MKILCYYQLVLLAFLSVYCKLLFQKIGRKLDDPKYNTIIIFYFNKKNKSNSFLISPVRACIPKNTNVFKVFDRFNTALDIQH